jgi:hypothetical protein
LIPEAPLRHRALELEPAALRRAVGLIYFRVVLKKLGGLPFAVGGQLIRECILRAQKILKAVCDFRLRHLPNSFTPERLDKSSL